MCNSYFKMKIYCFLAFAACCILSTSPAVAQTYFNDFEGTVVGPEWSSTSTDITTDTTPEGARKFLGQFDNHTVSLTLEHVPACNVTVSFDLFIIQTWDGHGDEIEDPSWGPDVWDLSVDGGPTLLNTTFASHDPRRQAYPDTYPGFGEEPLHPQRTGADENNTLGYDNSGDSVYNLSFTFAHAGGELVLNFSASGLQGIGDESWGLDNVLVNCPPPEETERIIEDIEEMGLPQGVENSLVSKLENAIDSMEKGQYNAAANQLNAFINQVEAQRGKKITEEQADALIAAAQWLIDNISNNGSGEGGKKK